MTVGLRKAPTFDMFAPSYIKDLESFTVRMPTTYVKTSQIPLRGRVAARCQRRGGRRAWGILKFSPDM